MLSILLYGRNDNHGYNLHKRAAISLNAMAELLTDPDDEIIFVDYNTPDDLPTFPEAIHDTLTQKAIGSLRILRVRPGDHASFASKTHLVALEPVARNVGLRRSNPANRWVLSTNTDMIFVPRERGRSLTDIVAQQRDGFYHLPRFELPEALWESLDRKDGRGIIDRVSSWGTRFHLEEIVNSGHANLYDAPGDFQLALRSDLISIDGFHEEMLIGWHVDANLAKRMQVLRGKVSSLAIDLAGFHCDHTRQSTAVHKRDRVANDVSRFVHNAVHAAVPSQRDSWGLPQARIEETRLSHTSASRYIDALERALPGPASEIYESSYTADTYNTFEYPAEHVVPYVLDLISCAPKGIRIGYAGARADMFALIADALGKLDPTAVMEPVPSATWLQGARKSRDDVVWLTAHELYIFETGETRGASDSQKMKDARSTSAVFDLFRRFVHVEDQRQVDRGLAPRRVIAINAIHTYFEVLVTNWVAHTTTPYSSRVRHGFVSADRLAGSAPPVEHDLAKVGEILSRKMGRTYPAPESEVRQLIELARTLPITAELHTPDWTMALNVAEPLIALITNWRTVDAIERDPVELEIIANLLEQNRLYRCPPAALRRFPLRASYTEAATRLADIDDWERPSWLAYARRYYRARGGYDYLGRAGSTWEPVTVLDELGREFGWGGAAVRRPRVLVVSHHVDHIASFLMDAGAHVDILDPLNLLDEYGSAVDWRGNLGAGLIKLVEPVGLFMDNIERKTAEPYDAVICPQNSAFIRGVAKASEIIAGLRPWVAPGGIFALTAEVRIDGEPDSSSISGQLVHDGRLALGMQACAGLVPLRGFNAGLSRRTADSRARPTAEAPGLESFIGNKDGFVTRGVWFWRAVGNPQVDRISLGELLATPNEEIVEEQEVVVTMSSPKLTPTSIDIPRPHQANSAVHDEPSSPVSNGCQMNKLRSAGSARISPRGVEIAAADPVGLFATASFGVAYPGAYELIFEARTRGGGGNALTVEIISGGSVIAAESFPVGQLLAKARRSIEFEIPDTRGAMGVKSLEVRMLHHGACDMELVNLSLYSGARV
jgi:hypothetical protein